MLTHNDLGKRREERGPKVKHLHYIDWLRVFAISLVVSHHAGQAYGPTGGEWMVKEQVTSNLLGPFFAVNAGFGMAFFFMLAGLFVPASLARKGAWPFARDRLKRLGIPLLIVGFLVFPLIIYLMDGVEMSFPAYYSQSYLGQGNLTFGHLWFVFHLLAYSLVVAALWPGLRRLVDRLNAPPGHAALVALTLFIAVLGSVSRMVWTQDMWINLFGVFPVEPVHLPQYVAMFLFGVFAGKNNWLKTLSTPVGFTWFTIGIGAAVLWYALRYLELYAGIIVFPAFYGWLFPLWEAVLCVGMCIGLLTFARKYWDVDSIALPHLARATYGVFIIHVFIVGGLQIAMLPYGYLPFAKFLIVSAVSIPLCFGLVMGNDSIVRRLRAT